MKRLLVWGIGGFATLAAVTLLAMAGGYYAHKLQLEPIFGLAERAEAKGRRVVGAPTKTVGLVDVIDTSFLRLRGTVYAMPNSDFQNGGALASWNDEVLVMHKSGRVHYLEGDEGLVVADMAPPDNGKEGYVRLANSPKYAGRPARVDALRYNDLEFIEDGERRGFLISYTYIDEAAECYRTRINFAPVGSDIASIRDVSISPEDWDLVWESNPCLPFNETAELLLAYMAGGRMAYKAPGLLYLGHGEYHADGIYRADAGIQDPDTDYGKTIEIDLNAGTSRVYSIGHRNLQGVTLDKQGRLWTTEHGMRGGDELNLIVDNENYGWPEENLGTLYSGLPAPSPSGPGRHEVYKAPAFAWLPSAAVSSMALVDGFHETWDGDLLIGTLKTRKLFRVRVQGDRVIYLEEIVIGQRVRDVMQIGDDKIALWLDTLELVMFEIEERADPLAGLEEKLLDAGVSQEHAVAAVETLVGCNECHSYEPNINGAGPSLGGVGGRVIASTGFANYSDALKSVSGSWTEENLIAYLSDPEGFAGETGMIGFQIDNPDVATAVAKGLGLLAGRQADLD